MTADFYDETLRVLTREAFEFVLSNELRRAARSQDLLTLVLMDAAGDSPLEGERPMAEIARVVSDEVRGTDLLARTGGQQLSLVLFDADLTGSMGVIDRVLGRLSHYNFQKQMSIAVGAACCPTDATDLESLRRQARARPVVTRRTGGPSHTNA
jgi:diguanylate cyclase (GGDEF)-like protein